MSLLALPDELLVAVLEYAGVDDGTRLASTCATVRRLVDTSVLYNDPTVMARRCLNFVKVFCLKDDANKPWLLKEFEDIRGWCTKNYKLYFYQQPNLLTEELGSPAFGAEGPNGRVFTYACLMSNLICSYLDCVFPFAGFMRYSHEQDVTYYVNQVLELCNNDHRFNVFESWYMA